MIGLKKFQLQILTRQTEHRPHQSGHGIHTQAAVNFRLALPQNAQIRAIEHKKTERRHGHSKSTFKVTTRRSALTAKIKFAYASRAGKGVSLSRRRRKFKTALLNRGVAFYARQGYQYKSLVKRLHSTIHPYLVNYASPYEISSQSAETSSTA
jgi:uncharacterized Rmd1/YagE family protein